MIRRLLCISALALAVLATSVPAAGAATVSPDKWAPKFCTAFQKWQKTITDESAKATASIDGIASGDLASVKDEFVTFLGKDIDATKAVIASIKKAGAPDVSKGTAIQSQILKSFQAAQDIFTQAKTDAANLSTTDPTSFVSDATQIQTHLGDASTKFGTEFDKAQALDKDNKVGSSLEKAKACSFLFSSS